MPGVGENLQDHLYVHHTYRATADSSINAELRGLRKYLRGAQYVMTKRGLLSLGASQAVAFVRAVPGSERPDLQLMFRPVSWDFSSKGTLVIGDTPAVGGSICVLRPHARGRVSLHGPSAEQPPALTSNYLGAASRPGCDHRRRSLVAAAVRNGAATRADRGRSRAGICGRDGRRHYRLCTQDLAVDAPLGRHLQDGRHTQRSTGRGG